MAKKNEAAVASGQRGGQARAANLSPQRRKQIAQHAAMTRWIKARQDHQMMIARLTITLDGPVLVRRQIEVPLSIQLNDLHRVFQAVMGWGDAHLFAFWTGQRPWQFGKIYYVRELDRYDADDSNARLAKSITLAEYIRQLAKKTFIYTYDFGDDWYHEVRIEAVADREAEVIYPRLLLAEGRCPPEDIGGPWGYQDYLDQIGNPDHPEHAGLVEWSERLGIDLPFDPHTVDEAEIKKRLQHFWYLDRGSALLAGR